MPVDGKLLEILCCPVSKTPLTILSSAKLGKLNSSIASTEVLFTDGKKVEEQLQEALITEDGKVVYPVYNNIPLLLEEKAIGTAQFTEF